MEDFVTHLVEKQRRAEQKPARGGGLGVNAKQRDKREKMPWISEYTPALATPRLQYMCDKYRSIYIPSR